MRAAAAPPPPVPLPAAAPARRPIVVGEACADRIGGRPAVTALFLRQGTTWSTDPKELAELLGHGRIPRFAVLGFTGKRAGMFTAAGSYAARTHWPVAVGAYAGASPCADDTTAAACRLLYQGCGPAVAVAGVDATEPISVRTGAACVVGNRLVVDIDGDGKREVFELPKGKFPDELSARKEAEPTCEARFAQTGSVDVVAVADLDDDGRQDLILQLREPERMWAVYSAIETSQRLMRVGVVSPWGEE